MPGRCQELSFRVLLANKGGIIFYERGGGHIFSEPRLNRGSRFFQSRGHTISLPRE